MQWSEVTEEEVKDLKFSSGGGGRSNGEYDSLLKAISEGKTIKVPVPEGKEVKNVKWAVSRAAKRAGVKITMKTLSDNSAVVVSLDKNGGTPAPETPPTEPPVTEPEPTAPTEPAKTGKK